MTVCFMFLLAVHVVLEAVLLVLLLRGRKQTPKTAPEPPARQLSAEREAFELLLQYSPEIAYGVSSMTQEE